MRGEPDNSSKEKEGGAGDFVRGNLKEDSAMLQANNRGAHKRNDDKVGSVVLGKRQPDETSDGFYTQEQRKNNRTKKQKKALGRDSVRATLFDYVGFGQVVPLL